MYQGNILRERFEFPANPANTYCVILFLRGFKKSSGTQGVFSQEQIAHAIPDFEGKTRQLEYFSNPTEKAVSSAMLKLSSMSMNFMIITRSFLSI
jgi:hypothetical protein